AVRGRGPRPAKRAQDDLVVPSRSRCAVVHRRLRRVRRRVRRTRDRGVRVLLAAARERPGATRAVVDGARDGRTDCRRSFRSNWRGAVDAMTAGALELLERARTGDAHAIARTLSMLENDENGAAELVRATHRDTGKATVIGVTGPPGGGKSTLVSALVGAYRAREDRVA